MLGRLKLVVLALLVSFLFVGASSEHLRTGSVKPPEAGVWHPHFPDKTNLDTYCQVWATKAIYGISAYLLASPEEREKSLVFTYQTGEYDRAHPQVFHSVTADDGSHATVIVITDGENEQGKWQYDDRTKRDIEDAMVEGWEWTIANFDFAESHRGVSSSEWYRYLAEVCKNRVR